ncbi:MAG: lysophospholipase [Myxococcota bacterium]|nr:lysophospholipase [Myxococcota bacterium]
MTRVIATAIIAYVALCVTARLGYRLVLYPAPDDPPPIPPAGAKLLSTRAQDGTTVWALQFPAADETQRVIVIFHGNGETIARGIDLALDLSHRGFGVLLAEYRGYGVSRGAGTPGEQGLYCDAIAVLDALEAQGIGRERIVVMGMSLGTGVAAEMARRGRAAALVLVSPYTSISAMARRVVPFLPSAWLCPDKFDTLSKAGEIHTPTLVVHGDADEVIPVAMGRAVAVAIAGAHLRLIAGGHHNDLFTQYAGVPLDSIAAFASGHQ